MQAEQRHYESAVKRLEDAQSNTASISESKRKQNEEQLAQTKRRLEQLTADEQEIIPHRMELEEEQRAEQTKLAQLQDTLDRIDKELERASAAGSAPQ